MREKILGVLLVTIILANIFCTAIIVKPSFAKGLENENLEGDFLEKLDETTLLKDAYPPNPEKTNINETPSSDDSGQWNFNNTSEWSKFAYADDNKTRLIIGFNDGKPARITELEKTVARHQAQIVNTVSIKGQIIAVIVELQLASMSAFVKEIRNGGLASYIEPSMRVQTQFVPNDPSWGLQWGPKKIEADWAWNTTTGDPSVLVAVVDTGVYYTHPDLAANYAPLGYDWVNMDADPTDDHGHGTHCAGIIAAVLNNSVGIAGLAQVRVMAEKVLDSGGGGYWDWVANGIIHAADSGADIISMSLGGYGDSSLVHDAVIYAYESGVLVIAAAGNDNTNMKLYPAGYDEVVAVAATDQYDNKAGFSNWGDWIEVAAPGVDIYSTVPWGYESWSGTSMATPHVSGVAALVWSRYPNASREWMRLWLRYTADDLGEPGFDEYFGYGRINARKAVEQVPPTHELIAYDWKTPVYVEPGSTGTVNATVLNFGEINETAVEVRLLANDTLVDSHVIGSLASGTATTFGLSWSPSAQGLYNITLHVVPVPGETSVENNVLWRYIYVGSPVKAVVLHSAGNIHGGIITNWQTLNSEWHLLGDTMIYIDYTTLNKDDITYSDIANTEADVLIISCAYDPSAGWQFTDSEIAAITRYVHEGHGLIVTAGTFYYQAPNNNKLAALLGINEAITWTATGTDLLNLLNTTHPLFANVPNPLVFPEVGTALPSDGVWDSNELAGGEYLALGYYQEGAIVAYRGLVYISAWLEVIAPQYHHHLQVLYNAITWSRYQKPLHELAVFLEAPSFLQPGESALLNATVSNEGLNNETDVELNLLIDDAVVSSTVIPELTSGASLTISYLWTPTIEKTYNVTAYSPPLPGEESALNNVDTVDVRVVFFIAQVAVLNSWDIPPYFTGGWNNNYQSLVNALNARGFYAQAVTNDDITHGILSFFDTLVMVDNVPNLAAVPFVVDFWSNGGGIVAFDSSICFLCYAGILPPESAGNNGYYVYWDYDTRYQAKISTEHPVTEGYTIGQIISGTYGDAEYRVDALMSTSAYPYYTTLVEDVTRPNRAYVSAYEPLSTGKVVHMWEQYHWDNTNLQLMILNALEWVKALHYEHDLGVRLTVPSVLELGASILVNATVKNKGLNNETNVELFLEIDGVVVNSTTIPELLPEMSYTISYLWQPTIETTYNVTAYAPPAAEEEYTANNIVTKIVNVRPIKYVLFDRTHATDSLDSYDTWVNDLRARGYIVETLRTSPITPDRLEGYDVFVIPQARYSYNSDELSAIQTFVYNGGGLLVIGDDYPSIYTSLTSFADITWTSGGSSGITTDITPHFVTTGVASVYLDAPIAVMSISGVAQDLVRDPAHSIMLAVSEQPCGKVLGFVDEGSLYDPGIMQADNRRLANNMIDWLAIPIRIEHDLKASLQTPAHLQPGNSALLNATVTNRGLNNETNVELQLLVNGSIVDSVVIPELLTDASYTLSHLWTPLEGTYNVTAYAPPVLGEDFTANNVATGFVKVRLIRGYVLFDQTHGTDTIYLYSTWITDLTQRDYIIETHSSGPITSPILEGYDVFVIPQAHVDYTPDELVVIQDFVLDGHGLLVIGDDYPWVYSSLTNFAGITWTIGGTGGTTSDITPHPVTEGVTSVYFSAPASQMYVALPATDLIRDWYRNIMLSASEAGFGKVLGIADEDTINDYNIGVADNLRLANNMIDWLASPRAEHDLAVYLDFPASLEGNSTLLNATVTNKGLSNETNVYVYLTINGTLVYSVTVPELLAGESYTTSFEWTPTRYGAYNVTAYAPPVPGEGYIVNNIATKWGYAYYHRTYVPHEWIGGGSPMGWHADDSSWAYVLPFDFPFYGTYYSTIYISSNGLITFTGPDSSFSNGIPALAGKLAIATAWDDWVTYDPYDIFIWQNSTHMGIRWYVRHYSSGAVANFETVLNLSGVIQFNYEFSDGPVSATVGISNGAGHMIAEDLSYLYQIRFVNSIVFTPFYFERICILTITATAGGATAPVPGTYAYPHNTTVEVTAFPILGYLLDRWELDTINVGSANPYTIRMDTDHTLRAVFTEIPPLLVYIEPVISLIYVGRPVTFNSMVAGGMPPLSYQWCLNGSPVSGATSSSWTFTPVVDGGFAVYLNVTDNVGTTVKSNVASVTVAPPLAVSISPLSGSILVGESIGFASNVSGGYPFCRLQWYLNGAPVSGATFASWTFAPEISGTCHVCLKVTDALGEMVQSDVACIEVSERPVGGYSLPTGGVVMVNVLTAYLALVGILTGFAAIRRRTGRKSK